MCGRLHEAARGHRFPGAGRKPDGEEGRENQHADDAADGEPYEMRANMRGLHDAEGGDQRHIHHPRQHRDKGRRKQCADKGIFEKVLRGAPHKKGGEVGDRGGLNGGDDAIQNGQGRRPRAIGRHEAARRGGGEGEDHAAPSVQQCDRDADPEHRIPRGDGLNVNGRQECQAIEPNQSNEQKYGAGPCPSRRRKARAARGRHRGEGVCRHMRSHEAKVGRIFAACRQHKPATQELN